MPIAHLSHRTVIHIGGDAAGDFLERLVTSDVDHLAEGRVAPSALLTPQGKILFDFLISRRPGGGFVADIRADQADDFIRRLTMYRLRAAVTLSRDDSLTVSAGWDEAALPGALADARFPQQAGVVRIYGPVPARQADVDAWDRIRIVHGVAESGQDYALADAFPHDVLMDRNGGVDFRKGCFVGQEVVSRMQHRGTARRRLVLVESTLPLPPAGTPVMAGERAAGQLGSVEGSCGLAVVRTDRVAEALAESLPLTADGTVVSLALPAWSGLVFEQRGSAADD
ncbi:hypothetical protein DFR52_10444 [Hoeflea marina]|uniref:CAF17 C-terminal domain-containing protein n=1 Tax=Hoeflea marina TaxID=274592 RepID=A0A317PF52_9HYPH|nr:folate-binding protein YgfZ [Hoeflea marina]PWV98755.1 hypothetical protein DFR52_10444 [Hoeflea marina]